MDRIKSLETIYIPCIEDLPPEAEAEKEEFRAEGIQSLISVPMIYKDTLLGFVGFDAVREKKECPEELINLAIQAGVDRQNITIDSEPLGINLFLRIKNELS